MFRRTVDRSTGIAVSWRSLGPTRDPRKVAQAGGGCQLRCVNVARHADERPPWTAERSLPMPGIVRPRAWTGLLFGVLLMVAGTAQAAGTYEDLVSLFEEWRTLER